MRPQAPGSAPSYNDNIARIRKQLADRNNSAGSAGKPRSSAQ